MAHCTSFLCIPTQSAVSAVWILHNLHFFRSKYMPLQHVVSPISFPPYINHLLDRLVIVLNTILSMSTEIKKMESNSLREQVAAMRQSLLDEEILDKQFVQMERLEDVDNPNFAEELMTLYFRDSTKLLVSVEQALERPPYDTNRLDKFLHQLKGSSASVGANKVWIETNEMREALKSLHVGRIKSQFQLVS